MKPVAIAAILVTGVAVYAFTAFHPPAAIGRGIGRTAVHEFTHQLLPTAPIHDSRDDEGYEYRSAARRAQYVGAMHWDLAWPLLRQKTARR